MKRLSPNGRLVQGNPLVGNPQTMPNSTTPKLGKDGTQMVNWYANVAFNKQDPDANLMVQEFFTEAARCYPALFPFGYQPAARQDTQPPIYAGGCIRPDFASKIVDGDSFDANGKPHSAKEGWGGHWIFKISTYAGAMRVVNGLEGNSPVNEVGNGHGFIKTGDFVRVALDYKTNGWAGDAQSKPGMFMNPDLVQVVGYGTAIVSGPNADEVFAQPAAYMPPGMSLQPTVAPMALPGTAGVLPQPLPLATPQPLPLPQTTALPVIPNHALVANVLQALPALTPPAPVYQMTPAAAQAGHTRESLNAQGHTDETLLANGYMIKVN